MWTNPGMFGDLVLGAQPPEEQALAPVGVAVPAKKIRLTARGESPVGSSRGDTSYGWEPGPGAGDSAAWGGKAMSGNPGLTNEALRDFLKDNQAVGWAPPQVGGEFLGGGPGGRGPQQLQGNTPGERTARAMPLFDKLLAQAQAASETGRKSFETTGQLGIGQQRSIADLANAEVGQRRQQLEETKNTQDQAVENQMMRLAGNMAMAGRSPEEINRTLQQMRQQAAKFQGRGAPEAQPFGVQLPGLQPGAAQVGVGGAPVRVGVEPLTTPGSGRAPETDTQQEAYQKLFGLDTLSEAAKIKLNPAKELTDADRLAQTALLLHRQLGDNAFVGPDGQPNQGNLDTYMNYLRQQYGEGTLNQFINPTNSRLFGQRLNNAFSAPSDAEVLSSKLRQATGNKPAPPGMLDKLGYVDPVRNLFALGSSLIGRYGR